MILAWASPFNISRLGLHTERPSAITNKRPRGLDACEQHCKISATDVSENVYLWSKMQSHALSLGVNPVVCIYILSMIEIYIICLIPIIHLGNFTHILK